MKKVKIIISRLSTSHHCQPPASPVNRFCLIHALVIFLQAVSSFTSFLASYVSRVGKSFLTLSLLTASGVPF